MGARNLRPGYYPNGINVKNNTAIFQPGIYYVLNGFSMDANSCATPATQVGDGSGGTMFYFADTKFVLRSRKRREEVSRLLPALLAQVQFLLAPSALRPRPSPGNVPAQVSGTVLFGPCRAPTGGTLCAPNCALNYGDPLGTTVPNGEQRGILFFQNRSKAAAMDFSGGGQALFSGAIYIHQCVTSGADTGVGCNATSAYNSSMGFGGNSGSGTIVGRSSWIDQHARYSGHYYGFESHHRIQHY